MAKQLESVSIGAMAAAAGVNVETIRFYQRKGLLASPRRERGEIRRYGSKDIARVKFVKAAQRLGFSLGEIGALLKLDDGAQCDEARAMAEHRLEDVRHKVLDLRRMESALEALVAGCRAKTKPPTCPLITALRRSDTAGPSRGKAGEWDVPTFRVTR